MKPDSAKPILVALVAGAFLGILSNLAMGGGEALTVVVSAVAEPIGRVWLRLLLMTVVPLVLASLCTGVVNLQETRRLGSMGVWTMTFFLASTATATAIGLFLINLVQPGSALSGTDRDTLVKAYGAQAQGMGDVATGFPSMSDFVLSIIPQNPFATLASGNMLAVIFFAICLGVALLSVSAERRAPLVGALEGLNDAMVVIIAFVMRLAPIGVFCLIFAVTARFGLELVRLLFLYVVVVLVGLSLHAFVVLPVATRFLTGMPVSSFLRRARVVILTAFSTSSSNATLPTTISVCQTQYGIPRPVTGFVLPLGATMNMNGTALFEGVTVLFIAQVFGIALSLGQQAIVVALATLSAIGVAGVPGGSIPLLMIVLTTVGLPAEGIAIVLGVDRVLDMCRTAVNVLGDVAAAAFVARRTSDWQPPVDG